MERIRRERADGIAEPISVQLDRYRGPRSESMLGWGELYAIGDDLSWRGPLGNLLEAILTDNLEWAERICRDEGTEDEFGVVVDALTDEEVARLTGDPVKYPDEETETDEDDGVSVDDIDRSLPPPF